MKKYLDRMTQNHNGEILNLALSHIGRLATAVGMMAGAFSLIKFSAYVFPPMPEVSIFLGIITYFLSIVLLVMISLDAWVKIAKYGKSTWLSHLSGLTAMAFTVFFGLAGYYAIPIA